MFLDFCAGENLEFVDVSQDQLYDEDAWSESEPLSELSSRINDQSVSSSNYFPMKGMFHHPLIFYEEQ